MPSRRVSLFTNRISIRWRGRNNYSDSGARCLVQKEEMRPREYWEDDDMRADLGLWNAPITLHSSDRAARKKADWDLKYWCEEELDGGIGQTNKRDSICDESVSNLNSRSKSSLTAVWELYLKECLLRGVSGAPWVVWLPCISLPSKVLIFARESIGLQREAVEGNVCS